MEEVWGINNVDEEEGIPKLLIPQFRPIQFGRWDGDIVPCFCYLAQLEGRFSLEGFQLIC